MIFAATIAVADDPAHVRAELLPLTEHIIPGEKLVLAVVFTMADDWHIYWQNPGDAGMSTAFHWQLPEGFKLLSRQEPAPTRLTEEGITTFIHEEEAIYLFTFLPPENLDEQVRIGVNLDWLECKSICLAGSDSLSVELAVKNEKANPTFEVIDLEIRAKSRLPVENPGLTRKARIQGDLLTLTLNGLNRGVSDIQKIDFFPTDELVYDIQGPPRLKTFLWRKQLMIPLLPDRENTPQQLKGVLAIKPAAPKSAQTQYFTINQGIKK